ncbi:hypothetical protein MKX03_033480, partial [Papaver bracteatum]
SCITTDFGVYTCYAGVRSTPAKLHSKCLRNVPKEIMYCIYCRINYWIVVF